MSASAILVRYRDLQAYVGWTGVDEERVRSIAALVEPRLAGLVEDFYAAIASNATTSRVITGGEAQIARLKGTLLAWLRELLAGPYDQAYVDRRWQVGRRHVEIGLPQVYTNAALSRLRAGLVRAIQELWDRDENELRETVRSVDKLLDLDLAIIEDAYQAEYVARQQCHERLATLGRIAGGVAHELRNPLNVLRTSAFYLLHARSPSAEKLTEHLQRIERQVELADGVISALTSFTRTPVPVVAPVEILPLLEDLLINTPGANRVQVGLHFPDAGLVAFGDADQLRIVFGNLIRNAIDAMPEGGRLRLAGCADSAGVEVEVTDTGVGIPPNTLGRIMEPLYTTKARGLGLGLSIACAIIERHGGTVRVASQPGAGTSFFVRLPLPELERSEPAAGV
jgi:signal transduction histidine kinase